MQTVDYRNNKRLLQEGVSFHWWDAPHPSLHNHNHYEFFIITCGQTNHILNGAQKRLSKNDLFLIRPEDCHQFTPIAGSRCIHINLPVTTAKLSSLCEALGISLDALLGGEELCIALNDVELAFFQSRAQQLNLIARSAEEPDRLGVLVICEMLVHAISLLYKKWRPFSADCPEWMQALLQKIHSPEYISCSAADVYRLAGYSPPVVIQYFRQYTGDTVTAYLTKAKMDFACSLLLTTQMTTIEIACQLGYSSLSHFNKCFRNHTGKSPREYRRAAGSQGR